MKQTMICLLLASGMLACNADKNEAHTVTADAAHIQHEHTADSVAIPETVEASGGQTHRHVQEIDSLLEGI